LYSRNKIVNNIFYYPASLAIVIGILYCVVLKKEDYAFFLILLFIPLEVLFNPKQIEITKDSVIILDRHLIGLIRIRKSIPFNSIKSISVVTNMDVFSDPNEDWSFPTFEGKGQPPFALYQITYLSKSGAEIRARVNLYANEFNIIRSILPSASV
jgi:hypothetical protein